MWRGLFVLLAASAAAAQTNATGSIAGVVRDASTGAPLVGVQVSLGSQGVRTDAQGGFRFAEVRPGTTRVWASDPERGAWTGVTIRVKAGEEARSEIRLKLGGSIGGRVVDSGGHPVKDAVVLLLARRYRFGQLVHSPSQSVKTDDDGAYRFHGVPAEEGFLVLAKKVLRLATVDELPPYESRAMAMLPELHSETITLTAGEAREHVEIRMPPSSSYCVEGVVDASAATPYVSFSEVLSFDSGWQLTPSTIQASAGGTFRVCGLHPGRYRIAASEARPGNTLAERFAGDGGALAVGEVLIANQDVRNIKPAPVVRVELAGDVTFDPAPRGKTERIDIGLTRSINGGDYADATDKRERYGQIGGMISTGGGTTVPGAFSLGRWRSGEWELRVSRVPPGCYVKEATYGRQDLLRGPLSIGESGGGERVRLVIGCDGGTFSARVSDRDGRPVAGAVLYLFDADAGNPGAFVASLQRADVADGWSRPIGPLRPGKYLALVTELDMPSVHPPAGDVEKLWGARGSAQAVEIGPGAVVQASITCLESPR